jgi:hypothetical protein
MPDDIQIPDLWGEVIRVDVRTPTVILKTQGELLQKRSKGILLAEIIVQKSAETQEILFDIRAPALGPTRQRVLKATHLVDRVYPVVVQSPGLVNTMGVGMSLPVWFKPESGFDSSCAVIAPTEEAFLQYLAATFQSGEVTSVIQSLIARSNEAAQPPKGVKIEEINNPPSATGMANV